MFIRNKSDRNQEQAFVRFFSKNNFFNRFLILISTAFLTSFAFADISQERGTDFIGNDYRSFRANTVEICVNACNDEARCQAYSWGGRAQQCWLKDTVGIRTFGHDQNSYAGKKVRSNSACMPYFVITDGVGRGTRAGSERKAKRRAIRKWKQHIEGRSEISAANPLLIPLPDTRANGAPHDLGWNIGSAFSNLDNAQVESFNCSGRHLKCVLIARPCSS